jgi:3-oxoacyl-[acyl-carrier-protein] synthase II
MMAEKRRVVITGMGIITPLGIGLENNWQSLCQGISGIGAVTLFDTKDCRTKIAGEVRNFNASDFVDKKTARRSSRFIHFALAASRMALEDAKLRIDFDNSDFIGTSIGTAMGGVEIFERNHKLFLDGNRDRVSPFFVPAYIANLAAGEVAIQLGAKGPLKCSVTACAAGTHSIGEAFKVIQCGDAEVMISGGSEAAISPVLFAGFDPLHVMSTRNNDPTRAVRPFERDRDGFVCSEGSGIIILEELDHALNRGARIYAEIIGYGNNCDAYHITTPDPDGNGACICMSKALKDANISTTEIDHINAHGTSTLINDKTETKAIIKLFGERSKDIPVTANKSMLGHLWGAAGAVEGIISVLTINNGIIPPTINYENSDPECQLDYVPNISRKSKVKTIMSNSFGFGGTNGCLIFKEYIK